MTTNMKKIFLTLFIALCLIGIVGAQETYRQSTITDVKVVCLNTGGFCSSNAECNLTIFDSKNAVLIDGIKATRASTGAYHNITLNTTQTKELGQYRVTGFCRDGSTIETVDFNFDITTTGVQLSTHGAIVYIGFTSLLIFLFIVNIGGIGWIPKRDIENEEGLLLSINKLKYVRIVLFAVAWALLMAIVYSASNISYLYLQTKLMGDLFFSIYTVMMTLTLPMVIVWFIWLLLSIFRDKETKAMIERGIPVKTP